MKLEDRPVVQVNDALLQLCNEAYQSAEARGASEVLVADLAWCAARSPLWPRDLGNPSMTPERLVRSAEACMTRNGRLRQSGPLHTSNDLKALLLRAERHARDAGREAADIRDFLIVLFQQSADLAGSDFVREMRLEMRQAGSDQRSSVRGGMPGRMAADRAAPRPQSDMSPRRGMGWEASFAVPRSSSSYAADMPYGLHGAGAYQTAVGDRGAVQDNGNTELNGRLDGLAEQIKALSERLAQVTQRTQSADRDRSQLEARMEARIESRLSERRAGEATLRSEIDELLRRLQMQDRQIGELRGLVESLAQQAMSATARLTHAVDLSRAQAELIAGLEHRLGRSEARRSGREGRRFGRGAARTRLRRSRRRNLRLRFRQRRRMRMRARRGERRTRSARAWSRTVESSRASPTNPLWHAAPNARFLEMPEDRFDAVPRLYVDNLPERPTASLAPQAEYEDEPVVQPEEDDETEMEGALGERPKRFYLALGDVVERAPSIGPRTAERLTRAGVATVRDLLVCDPHQVASRVQSRYVSAERIAAWKCQSRLVCTVPWLRGTHAQLLVGAGYDTLEKLQRAETAEVCASILRFASTRDGQSVLRSGEPPAPERVAKWIGNVTLAEPERARLAA